MKILIVANKNTGSFSPFILEQAKSLSTLGIRIFYFGIVGKGVLGYLSNWRRLLRKIDEETPDIIHAHYGLSGLLANLQRKVPVVTTYHGSDIHSSKAVLLLSKLSMCLSKYNIFVSQNLFDIAAYRGSNACILSCGVDLLTMYPMDKAVARTKLGMDFHKKYILFSGAFDNDVKDYAFARSVVNTVKNVELIELKGYVKNEVNALMNACDLQLTTSDRESGPLVVKEAMACNRPIVTADVGDVAEIIADTEGCYVLQKDIDTFVKAITNALEYERTKGRERIKYLGLDLNTVAHRIIDIYNNFSK